jgi:hypothetical protein
MILISVFALAQSAALAQGGVMPVQPNVNTSLTCFPSTSTNMAAIVIILNNGNVPVAAGTVLHWSYPRTVFQGDYVLPGTLSVGYQIVVWTGSPGTGMGIMQFLGPQQCKVTIRSAGR